MTKPKSPSIKAGMKAFGAAPPESEGSRQKPESGSGDKRCARKPAAKTDIADQIGLHLRSIYDDILAQPVPARFLDLLQELESTPNTPRLRKGGM